MKLKSQNEKFFSPNDYQKLLAKCFGCLIDRKVLVQKLLIKKNCSVGLKGA